MDFELPEEMEMVRSMVRDFVTEQLRPLERGILGGAADLSDSTMYLAPQQEQALVGMVRDMGLWGVGVPDELGGAGLGTLGSCLVEEELAQTVVPFNFGDVTPLLFDCDEGQRERYFVPALNREKYPYLALMEGGEGAPTVDKLMLRAEKQDDCYVLNGGKLSFSRAGADYFAVVFGVTDPSKGAREGVTCFLVDRGTPGFEVSGGEEKTGWEAQVRKPLSLMFKGCRVPAGNVLGEEGKAFSLGKRWLPARRIVRAARCVGVGERILEECTVQAQNWTSFGQLIGGRPSVKAALGDIAANVHAARLMVYEAAWKADRGDSVRREGAMVKLLSAQMIHLVADNAAHIYNAPAYVGGLPMERFCRDALTTGAGDFALQAQRNVIADDVLKGLRV